ncbi:MAG: phosphate signaling complex protein PhoU, partial [bacterium]
MERHLDQDISNLKHSLVKMAGMVEQAIDESIKALKKRDSDLAQRVIDQDALINALEIQGENLCLTIMARQQPVAADLRFLLASVKINNDLERMGDHAVNIAQKAQRLMKLPQLKPLIDIPYIANLVQTMLKYSLDSFVDLDARKAKAVCESDDEVDAIDHQIQRELLTYMLEDPKTISQAMDLTLVSKNLERIADLSTNIGEEVIFIV